MNNVIFKIPTCGNYTNINAIENTLSYIFRFTKSPWHRFYGIYPMTCDNAIKEFNTTRNIMPNTIEQQVWQFILCFPTEIQDSYFIMHLSDDIAYLFANEYQICYAMHTNKKYHKHVHFIVSSTSYLLNNPPLNNIKMRQYIEQIKNYLHRYNITITEVGKHV